MSCVLYCLVCLSGTFLTFFGNQAVSTYTISSGEICSWQGDPVQHLGSPKQAACAKLTLCFRRASDGVPDDRRGEAGFDEVTNERKSS